MIWTHHYRGTVPSKRQKINHATPFLHVTYLLGEVAFRDPQDAVEPELRGDCTDFDFGRVVDDVLAAPSDFASFVPFANS